MEPLILIATGIAALASGALTLRRYGPRYRVGRLLAATPMVSIAEARQLAGGPPRFVGVRGRIDADATFEDEAHRPLVLRRARVQIRDGTDWVTVDEHRQTIAFEVREGIDAIAVHADALDDGLIVVPRESAGTAADVPDRVPDGTAPGAEVRLRVDQVSAVEHAIVLGVPVLDADVPTGMHLTAGLGRPLILTTLERGEAMRVLTEGGRQRPLVAAIALAGGLILLTLGLALALLGAATQTALAASPTPSAAGGDPRSVGQGPGLVGDPLTAIAVVLGIGLLAVAGTVAYIRLTGGRRA